MPARRLIEVDLQIAKLRETIASGKATNQIEQIQLDNLLKERAKLIVAIEQEMRDRLSN